MKVRFKPCTRDQDLGDVDKLLAVGDGPVGMGGARPGRAHGLRQAEGDRAGGADLQIARGGDERRRVRALELALEEPVELRVPGRLLAVWHCLRSGLRRWL